MHNLFCCCFLESFSFSLGRFSEAALEAEHGPPTHALLGLPQCCIAREMGSKAFCYLCCVENGSFSVCDNLNRPYLIPFFIAMVIPQPAPRFVFLEITHDLMSSAGCPLSPQCFSAVTTATTQLSTSPSPQAQHQDIPSLSRLPRAGRSAGDRLGSGVTQGGLCEGYCRSTRSAAAQ